MAEGFLEQSMLELSNFMEVGNEYFKALLSMSFFQPSTHDESSKFVMHNLMNDLAKWVSGRICLHLPTNIETNNVIKFENPRHLSLMRRTYEDAKRFEKFPTSKGLRSFIVLDQGSGSSLLSSVLMDRVIPNMRSLKLLCLRGYNIKKLPDSISDLKQLRHLDMSYTQIKLLPESICDLSNLQVLKLIGCGELIELPREIRKLINLRLLDIRRTYDLNVMPTGIGRLKNLEILPKCILGEKHDMRLNEFKDLSLLRGKLSIWGLEKVMDVQEAIDANLKAKEGLVSLEFKWIEETTGVEMDKQLQILDELQPHTTLRSLKIDGYGGKHFPKWVGDCSFTNLEILYLHGCNMASSLPPLGGLMSLKKLNISGMHEVKRVGKEFLGNTSNSNKTFPSLEILILEEMNGLEEWCSCFGSEEKAEVVFPRLQKMEISNCPVLVGRLPNQLPLLEELSISGCPNLRNLECRHPSLRTLVIQDSSEVTLKTLGNLTSLTSLKLDNIRDLICMEDEMLSMLGALQELEILSCGELKSLVRYGKEIEGLARLQRLTISSCDELVSFGPMRLSSSLKQMNISNCDALVWLPDGFMMDGNNTCESALERLTIFFCPSLTTFPRGRFPDLLVTLVINECNNLISMPEFSNSLKYVTIIGCNYLQSLPKFPASVISLSIGNLKGLALESTTAIAKSPLNSSNGKIVQYLSSFQEYIEIVNVEDVESETENMFVDCSFSIASLVMSNLNLRRLPENISSFQRIKELDIMDCGNLRWLPKEIHELNCLRGLTIMECPNLELLDGQDLPRKLERLVMRGCEKAIERLFAGGLSPLVSLAHLDLDGGSCVLDIKQKSPVSLPKLQSLLIANFGNLENLAAALKLPSSIKDINIEECAKLRELPIAEFSSSLGCLSISGCPLLKKRCLDRKGEYWPLLSIIPQVIIDHEDVFGSGVEAKRVGLFDAWL